MVSQVEAWSEFKLGQEVEVKMDSQWYRATISDIDEGKSFKFRAQLDTGSKEGTMDWYSFDVTAKNTHHKQRAEPASPSKSTSHLTHRTGTTYGSSYGSSYSGYDSWRSNIKGKSSAAGVVGLQNLGTKSIVSRLQCMTSVLAQVTRAL